MTIRKSIRSSTLRTSNLSIHFFTYNVLCELWQHGYRSLHSSILIHPDLSKLWVLLNVACSTFLGSHNITPLVDAEDANVYVRSSDNVLFGLHAINIKVVTGGFPFDSSYSTTPGVPDLPESAALLERLFVSFYPDFPDIEFTDFSMFEDLLNFAESAAKYNIRPAQGISKEFLR